MVGKRNAGFTLIEMLVVIGIIGILIVALVPTVQGAQVRAKEGVVKANCAIIETALANYAQSHGGNYPGVAVDVMAPWGDHALGDPALYPAANAHYYDPGAGIMVAGIIGGYGHYNPDSRNVYEQLREVKNTQLVGNEDMPRYFDSLIAAGSIETYPGNPFESDITTGNRKPMYNVFRFSLYSVDGGGFDPNNGFSPGVRDPETAPPDAPSKYYSPFLHAHRSKDWGGPSRMDYLDEAYYFHWGVTPETYSGIGQPNVRPPEAHDRADSFGVGTTDSQGRAGYNPPASGGAEPWEDFYAPGDFAYVPVLSASSSPFGDSAATIENETFKWGTNVTGYLLFGLGSKNHKSMEFGEEMMNFMREGLPGFGSTGVDTTYESNVLSLFQGAVYFSKKY